MIVSVDLAKVAHDLAAGLNGGARDAPELAAFVDWAEFWSRDRTEPEWLFEDVLARGRAHAIYAKHGTGKSLFALWIATEVVKAGHVAIYADWEMGEDDLFERLSDMGHGADSDLSRLRYLLLPSLPPLNTAEGAHAFGGLIDEVQAGWPERHLAVVIDTIGRAVVGEENSNDTIQGFYRHTGIGLKQRGVTWIRLDHAGHEGGHARGASAKGDDVDVVWRLAATDDGIELRADKRRIGWVPEKVAFRVLGEPVLRFEKAAGSWPAGTHEVARLLDGLEVSEMAGMRTAKAALSKAGQGRRGLVVEAAQRYRRMVAELRSGGRETPPETPPRDRTGDTPGDARQEPRKHRAETLPETPGDAGAAGLGDSASLHRGDAASPARSEGGKRRPDVNRCSTCGKRRRRAEPGEAICRCEGGSRTDDHRARP